MSEEQTLTKYFHELAQLYVDTVLNKSIEDLGGIEEAVLILINEVPSLYHCSIRIAQEFESFLSIYTTNQDIINNNFSIFNDMLKQVSETLAKQDVALAESLNKSLRQLNRQMTNQNKVLDKQVIKLSKSISKIIGGNS